MQHRQGAFMGAGELTLYYQSWHPLTEARATLVLIHGLGGHSGLFSNVVQYLVPRGFVIYGFDMRGHGRSPGQRGHIETWSEFREDVHAFLQLIDEQEPDLPCFIMGHSLGGVVALDYAIHYPDTVEGLIASALPLGQVGVPPRRMASGHVFSRVRPRFTLNTGIDASTGSRDQAVVLAYADDPLRHTRGTARLATEFLTTTAHIRTHAADLKVPILLLHGGADRVALPEGSRSFFEQVAFPDKERREYPGAYHELHEDLNYQEILTDLADWLERHLEVKALI